MQFIDLQAQYQRISDKVQEGFTEVLNTSRYIMGPQIAKVEERLADYVGVKQVLTCSSGTSALIIPLKAYELKENDAIFVPSFTFFASAEAVNLAGGTPVFVDSEPDTFNISIDSLAEQYDRVVREGKLNPRGVMAVDLFGQPADYEALEPWCKERNLFLLEDAAQSFGGTLNGKRAGAFGDVAATSFFPAKPLGCYGDGGAIFFNDDKLLELINSIRVHGQGTDKYDNVRIGINGRFDTLQAVVIDAKLDIFDEELELRNKVAQRYADNLSDIVEVPKVVEGRTSSWAQYTLKLKDRAQRDAAAQGLKDRGIPTSIYYPIPIHMSKAYQDLGYAGAGSLPVAEELSKRVLSLPMHPYLEENEQDKVIAALREVIQ